jgi:hypothetical protein
VTKKQLKENRKPDDVDADVQDQDGDGAHPQAIGKKAPNKNSKK